MDVNIRRARCSGVKGVGISNYLRILRTDTNGSYGDSSTNWDTVDLSIQVVPKYRTLQYGVNRYYIRYVCLIGTIGHVPC